MAKTAGLPPVVIWGGVAFAAYTLAANRMLGNDMYAFSQQIRAVLANLSRPAGQAS